MGKVAAAALNEDFSYMNNRRVCKPNLLFVKLGDEMLVSIADMLFAKGTFTGRSQCQPVGVQNVVTEGGHRKPQAKAWEALPCKLPRSLRPAVAFAR